MQTTHPQTVQPSIGHSNTYQDSNTYQAKGTGMGYNVTPIIFDCADIPIYDTEVKVKMQGNKVWMNQAN